MRIDKRSRTELKQYFVKNAIPTESNFGELIDGMLSQKDDGIAKLPNDPLSIEAAGDDTSQKKAIHFYSSFSDADPTWVLSLNPRQVPADPRTARPGFSISNAAGVSRLFIDRDTGNVGIGTTAPAERLHVANNLAVQGVANLSGGLVFEGSVAHIERDGALYRHTDGQCYLTVDDNLYIRDVGAGSYAARFDTNTGNLEVKGQLTASKGKILATEEHLQLRRAETERTGGKTNFLELYQNDVSPAVVPTVYPYIRFHHGHRFWHRLEAREDGLHVKTGNQDSDSYSAISAGSASFDGWVDLGHERGIASFDQPLTTGAYQNNGLDVSGDVPDTSHPWSHLLVARHSNAGNHHSLEIAASYAENDRLFFRKIARGLDDARRPGWTEVATRGTNVFTAYQKVSSPSGHLELRREKTEATGGKALFLELFQDDNHPAAVPSVYPSIRFHHAYRFWHRLEAREDGLHVKTGDTNSDAYSSLRASSVSMLLPAGDLKFTNIFTSPSQYVEISHGDSLWGITMWKSQRSAKKNIVDLDADLDTSRLYDLRPVAFNWASDPQGQRKTCGLVAEDVEAVMPQLVMYDGDGHPFGVNYSLLAVLLLNELKKLRREAE